MNNNDHPPDQHIVHEYDGILEADNRLPRWWLYTLYGAIVFAMFYWLYYESYGTGASPRQVFDAEKMARAKIEAERLNAAGPITPEQLVAMSQNAAVVESGKAIFTANCVSCHLATGGGQVGPNLTDEFWIHGGKPEQILTSVRAGFLDKGMPPWGQVLGETKVREVAAYALTLKNTNVAGGKAPQGEKE